MPRRTKATHTAAPKDDDDDLVLLETSSWALSPDMTAGSEPGTVSWNAKRVKKRLSLGLPAEDCDLDADALSDGAGAAVDWRITIPLTQAKLGPEAEGKGLEVEPPRKESFAFCKCNRNLCKKLAVGLVVWLLLLLIAALIYFYANINDGLHISYGDTPTEMTVTWFSNSQLVPPTVVVRAREVEGAAAVPDAGRTLVSVGRSDGYSKSFLQVQYVNRVTVAGLRPGATYEYIHGEGATAAEFADPDGNHRGVFRFHVPSEDQPSVSMAVLGDMGAFNMAVLDYLQDDVDAGNLDFAFHLGDFGYDLDSFFGLVGDLFFSKLKPVAGAIPYMATPGNHESYWDDFNQYMNRFTMPQHAATKNLWYSFEVGPVSVISISSEVRQLRHYFTPFLTCFQTYI